MPCNEILQCTNHRADPRKNLSYIFRGDTLTLSLLSSGDNIILSSFSFANQTDYERYFGYLLSCACPGDAPLKMELFSSKANAAPSLAAPYSRPRPKNAAFSPFSPRLGSGGEEEEEDEGFMDVDADANCVEPWLRVSQNFDNNAPQLLIDLGPQISVDDPNGFGFMTKIGLDHEDIETLLAHDDAIRRYFREGIFPQTCRCQNRFSSFFAIPCRTSH